jgi:flagellar biosynthetic protein FlhB
MGRRIRDAAGQHNIATVEKPSLAQAVYRVVAVNRPIPAEHYTAVAEVLTAAYQRDVRP